MAAFELLGQAGRHRVLRDLRVGAVTVNRPACLSIPARYSGEVVVTAPSARQRLVEVASRLFYAEGIHAAGVDRVIVEARVAKATLYAHFASKEELVAAYLERQSAWWVAAVEERADSPGGLLARALAPFDVLAERAARPGYRGCPFINAAAEFPEPGPVADQISRHRRRVRDTFADLLDRTDEDPGLLDVIVALYDGAMTGAYLDRDPAVVNHARRGAEELLGRCGSW